ncbi:putative polyketide synthase [Hypoxylon crocopeplum]|nr:putative polyketide synthase [Hypoxylon crocopeplum]
MSPDLTAGCHGYAPANGSESCTTPMYEPGKGESTSRMDPQSDRSVDPELDGFDIEPIAICGFSIKFPQDATSPEGLWKMITEKRCAMTDFPANRLNRDGFYAEKNKSNTLPLKGGHFIEEDPSVFDADFFSISPAEATAMDPMQRWLLEAAYRALENAGITMESVSGSSTAVYTGSFGFDYLMQLTRDSECPPQYAALGLGLSMLANRISWFFNLRGPSIGLDSACSSTAMAIDIACRALRDKSCDMSMVTGCNLTFSPEVFTWMTNINFLSPDSRCHSFDHRANGYARGEGVGVMIIKRLSDALRDGNTIRAVIRATGSNEDGRTPGITQPSSAAQEQLIKNTYRKAGLSMSHTRYFEAHGTGTPIGDPREAQAIGAAFREYRSKQDPVFVGAIKSNIGHLEGASGLAGVIKTVLALEKGVIPPNTNFERLNPKIDAEFLRLQFPERSYPWPVSGLRRASVNSFGYGGANCHIVLDDAYNFLRLRSLSGKHCTQHYPALNPLISSSTNGLLTSKGHTTNGHTTNGHTTNGHGTNGFHTPRPILQSELPGLFIWSAADKDGIGRVTKQYEEYYAKQASQIDEKGGFLADFAYTLGSHRSYLPWRSFALLRSPGELNDLHSRISAPTRANANPARLGFIFTGQGAQWYAMGRELMSYSSFKMDMKRAEQYLKSLGCRWSIIDELLRPQETSKVDNAEFSQTLCTILQVAIVNLLRRFDIGPAAVVGHSSGEIAAAYAGGYLTDESAWKLAYFRGLCSAELESSTIQSSGTMLSVGLPEDRARDLVATTNQGAVSFGISIACVNSPNNVTISGEAHLIDQLATQLDEQKVFARKLRVRLAYHSGQMKAISAKYISMVGSLSGPQGVSVPMISSVTGKRVTAKRLRDPSYWALNMESPVLFSQAVMEMCSQSAAALVKKIDKSHIFASVVDHLVEIGPHAALQGPLRDILRSCPRGTSIGYTAILRRKQSAMETLLNAMGELHCMGNPMNLRAINEPGSEATRSPSILVDLPEYPFDHSQRYWHETRLSKNYRFRQHAPSELLGVRSRDWNSADARWRHLIRISEIPWTEQHVINSSTLYPAAGMLAMAIEAAKQLVSETKLVEGYTLRDIRIENPITLSANNEATEVQTSLRSIPSQDDGEPTFEFAIRTYINDDWLLNCSGFISVEILERAGSWVKEKTAAQRSLIAMSYSDLPQLYTESVNHQHMYDFLKQAGLEYGPLFQAAQHQRYSQGVKHATAEISLFKPAKDAENQRHVIHPTSLDAIMHLSFTALTFGGSLAMATSVPSRLNCLWVSNRGLSWPSQEKVSTNTTITKATSRGFVCKGVAMDCTGPKELRLWYDGLEMTNVTRVHAPPPNLPNPQQFCMNVECKVALDKLKVPELESLLARLHPVEEDLTSFFRDIEILVTASLKELADSIDLSGLESQDMWKRRYLKWTEHHLAKTSSSDSQVQETGPLVKGISARLENTNPIGRLYVAVASNLVGLLKGDVNPLELLIQTGILKDYYEWYSNSRCTRQIVSYVDLLAHQNPGMSILEVGGGTGAGTRNLVSALCARPGDPTSLLRCGRYDFTDASAVFMDEARSEFQHFHSQMTFGVLDIGRDFAEQGFRDGQYDLVLAAGVLHVTADLAVTLRRVRKALKQGGKLIMQESFDPAGWTLGFVFGLFPGWWPDERGDRLLSPNISVDTWDTLLAENGFSGVDVLLDFGEDLAFHYGWIVSTATEEVSPNGFLTQRGRQVSIVVNGVSEEQNSLARDLQLSLTSVPGVEPVILSIEAAVYDYQPNADELVISLLDYEQSFLQSLEETTWKYLHTLLEQSRNLLWVTSGGGQSANPDHGMLDGLARTLRLEYFQLHLVTLALEGAGDRAKQIPHVMQIVHEMAARTSHQNYEQEYVEMDGILHTRRLVEAQYLKSEMDKRLGPYEIQPISVGEDASFTLSTGFQDQDEPHYIPMPKLLDETLGPDDVDMLVKAVSLGPGDRIAALGSEESPLFGSFCSGVVLRAGPEAPFHAGDRVVAAWSSSFRSHVRVLSDAVARIPHDLSFTDACCVVPAAAAAYNALVEVGRVQPSDWVLVRNGASPAGAAAIQLLASRYVGRVWTTVTSKDESAWIAANMKLPHDHILPDSWFGSPMLSSQWREAFDAFDLVLSVEPHSSMPLDTSYVQPGGRYVVLRSGSSPADKRQHLYSAARSVSLSIIELKDRARGRFTTTEESIRYAAQAPRILTLDKPRSRAALFPASDLTNIFHTLKSTNGVESVVVQFDDGDVIDVRLSKLGLENPHQLTSEQVRCDTRKHQLRPDRTYLIAGGLGGLGRGIARWMARCGARNLILLSRSGPRTSEALELLTELRGQDVNVATPRCDVTDLGVLESVLTDCLTRMPPIAGCIQASMVMTELIFQKMEFHHWKASIDSKVRGSWNLHAALPKDLDFFILTSSVMGILGTGSLAAYNAGNTYQDALARYRVSLGYRAASLDLGGILDEGYLAENGRSMVGLQRDRKHEMMWMAEVYALLDIYCNPGNTLSSKPVSCQPIVGIRPSAYWKHIEEVPFTIGQPFWGHMHHIPLPSSSDGAEDSQDAADAVGHKRAMDTAARLTAAGSLAEAAEVISQALAQRISAVLGTAEDRLDLQKPMHSYGIDSLSAIDLRNWIGKVFDVDMPVFEILGGATLASAGMTIARKVRPKE